MDDDDKCISYGHATPRESLEYVIKKNGTLSRRRKKVLVCTRCGGRL